MAQRPPVFQARLQKVFADSQQNRKGKKCLTEYMKLFREFSDDDSFLPFITTTGQLIISVFRCPPSSPFTKRSIAVIAEILAAVSKYESEEDAMPNLMQVDEANDDPELGTVDHIIQNYIAQCLLARDEFIRENAVSLFRKLFETIEKISISNLSEIVEALDTCTTDGKASIRVNSLATVQFIQNLFRVELISNKLQFHLQYDPEMSVRFSVLMHMEFSSKTLAAIVLATQDVQQSIRLLAYTRIASNTNVTDFEAKERLILLSRAMFNDQKYKNGNSLPTLINGWLNKLTDTDLVIFLNHLNIQANEDSIEKILNAYFHHLVISKKEEDPCTPFQIKAMSFKSCYLDVESDQPNLTPEVLFLWRLFCQFAHNEHLPFELEPTSDPESSLMNGPKLVDHLVPSLTLFGTFINKLTCNWSKTPNKERKRKQFLLSQLLKLGKLLPIQDVFSWSTVAHTLEFILDRWSLLQMCITPVFEMLSSNVDCLQKLVRYMVEKINHPPNELIFNLESSLTRQENELVELNQELDGLLIEIDIDHEKYNQVLSLRNAKDDEIKVTKQELQALRFPLMEESQQVLLQSLHICHASFNAMGVKNTPIPLDVQFIEKMSVLAFKSSKLPLIDLALKCLGFYSLARVDAINRYLGIFLVVIPTVEFHFVRSTALGFFFDFIAIHGFSKIKLITEDSNGSIPLIFSISSSLFGASSAENILDAFTSNSLLETLQQFISSILKDADELESLSPLDSQLFEITIKGIAKLLSFGRLHSPQLLGRLIVVSICPTISPQLKSFFNGFFPYYAANPSPAPFIAAIKPAILHLKTFSGEGISFEESAKLVFTVVKQLLPKHSPEHFFDAAMQIIQMLSEECAFSWIPSLQFIQSIDGKQFTKEQLQLIVASLKEFLKSNNSGQMPVVPKTRACKRNSSTRYREMTFKIIDKYEGLIQALESESEVVEQVE